MKINNVFSMSKVSVTTAVGIASYMLLGSGSASAASLPEAISGGTPKVDVRLRYESVDQDAKDKTASALTNRTRVGYLTGDYMGAQGYVEFENVTAIEDNYDFSPKATVGDSTYPVVADPEGSEVNQLFLSYTPMEGSSITAGRQRIILDNARFVGNVGWRQNEQTFDAFRISTKALPDTSIDYAYVTAVNTILGGTDDMASHLFTAAYNGLSVGKISVYTYMLDYDDKSDSQTIGGSFAGSLGFGEGMKALYRLEYATMGDYADNDSGNSADYTLVELGATAKGITGKFGYEVLGGDGTTSFNTPLATKHKFNGWADKFLLATPADGLVDTYVSAGTAVKGVKLLGVYHTFSADNGGDDYGSEIDLLAATKFAKIFNTGVKYAAFSGEPANSDISKLWVWVGAAF